MFRSKGLMIFVIICLISSLIPTSESKAAYLTVPPWPTNVPVNMYELLDRGDITGTQCSTGDIVYGCTAFCYNSTIACEQSQLIGYPYSTSTIYIPIEKYYLLDVVSSEMNPWKWSELVALQAQAIAARSFIGYHLNNSLGLINNSMNFKFLFHINGID